MKTVALPLMERHARELVNEGRYGLYCAHEPIDPKWIYYMSTRGDIYALDAEGMALALLTEEERKRAHFGETVHRVLFR